MIRNRHDAYIQYINHIAKKSNFFENLQILTQSLSTDDYDIDFTKRTNNRSFIYFVRLRPYYKDNKWVFLIPRRLKIKLGIFVEPNIKDITIVFENNKKFKFDNSFFDKDNDVVFFDGQRYIDTRTLPLHVSKFDILSQLKVELSKPKPILIKCIELCLDELIKFIYIDCSIQPIGEKIYTQYKILNVEKVKENCASYFLFIKEDRKDIENDLIYFLTYNFCSYNHTRKFYIFDEKILDYYQIYETSLYISYELTCNFNKNKSVRLELPLFFEPT